MNCRLRARFLAATITLALMTAALAVTVPGARASWTQSWDLEPAMGATVSQSAVVGSPEGIVYVMGGVLDMGYAEMSAAYSYDTETGSWTVLDTMPSATRGAAVAMGDDGRVFVFAGTADFTQIYNPDVDLWTLGETMPYPAWEAKAATVANGSMWVVGGEGAPSGAVQIYDPSTDSWSMGPSAPVGVMCGALVAVGNDLYYSGGGAGGYTGTDNMFKYDSGSGDWVDMAPMPEPVAGHSMVEGIDGLLYVVGGAESGYNSPMDAYDTVYAYDPVADEWSVATSMDYERTYLGVAATSDGKIWALGGNTPSAVLNVVESLQLYEFTYSVELSSDSARAGESVLLMVDGEFTYIEEWGNELYWILMSADGSTVYASDYMWISSPSALSLPIDLSAAMPAGDYLVVLSYWYSYADGAYEYVEDIELELEVLPAPEPADVLIAELEAQIADLQAQIDDLSDELNATEADLTAEISALQAQVTALQDALDALDEDSQTLLDEIAALQDQVESLQSSLNDVQTSVDSGEDDSALLYAVIALLIVVIVLMLVMMMMGRNKPSTPPPPES